MYEPGDIAHLPIEVKDLNGALADSTITLNITLPDQTVAGPFTPTRASIGEYFYDYTAVQAGLHRARWVGTGAAAFGHTDVFNVEPPDISIVSLSSVKRQLAEPPASTADDDELRSYLLSASENIETACGPCAVRSFTERINPRGQFAMWLSNAPVVSLTSFTGVYTWSLPLATTDVTFNPTSGKVTLLNRWCPFYGEYDVTYKAGRAVIPASIRTACLIIVQHLWDTRRGPVGVSPGGDDMVTLPGWGYAVPGRAAALLGGFQKTMLIA